MSVQDTIKKSILESDMFNQAINVSTIFSICLNMLVAVFIGLLIYCVYKKFFNGVVYSRSYGLTLIGMTILTCMVTLAISTNIVISLGMVGALSIVRYRTAIKEPLDLLYMFWAITSGITIGASMYILVVTGFCIMLLFIWASHYKKDKANAYVLVLQYEGLEAGDEAIRILSKTKYVLKSKIIRGELIEMTLQVECKGDDTFFVEKIQTLAGVKSVTLVQYNGEYHG